MFDYFHYLLAGKCMDIIGKSYMLIRPRHCTNNI